MDTFKNVVGYDTLKQELVEVIDLMQNEETYAKLGVSCPKGLLLYGRPGVGKTLIANSFIEGCGRNSIVCRKNAAEQSFIDTICQAFDEALKRAPSIILLDDMDKFANDDDNHKDSEAYVTIQTCIDLVRDSDVFVLATANNIRKLPESLIRTGRFDRKICVAEPSEEDSQLIIEHYLKNKNFDSSIDIKAIASLFRGSSCSTLETVINQAGMLAGYKRAEFVTMDDLIKSYLMIVHNIPKNMLVARPVTNIHANDGSMDVFWHEAGHIVMNEIISPGSVSLAIAINNDEQERGFVESSFKNAELNKLEMIKSNILISLASTAAIDIEFGRVDPGAESDIDSALRSIEGLFEEIGGFAGLSRSARDWETSQNMFASHEAATSGIAELYLQEAKELLCQNRCFLEGIAMALAENVILVAEDIAEVKRNCL